MKKIIVFIGILFTTLGGMTKENIFVEGIDKLPLEAQYFVNKYLPKERVVYVKISRNIYGQKKYLAVFSSGMKVKFNSNGTWVSMFSKQIGLPKSVIPQKIWEYVNELYFSVHIISIEKLRNKILKIALSNNKELYFYNNGIKIDQS
jgi:hypothetical protein